MKVRHKTIVPRNPFAVAAHQRKAGSHEQTHKAKRKQDKQQLHKMLRTQKGVDSTPFLYTLHHVSQQQ
ncbi:hypothetical protein [Neisseria sp. Ec49-e6-T10]|uniref:hypothetical protein n=1 Tax=Neisseria sp. Ec49-e6-T10 TaxID=3140744 RepID=UPI003EB9A3B4